jgi:hypothetical protein
MRTLRVIEFLSLDGVMRGASAAQGMAAADAYLFARKTYEKMPRTGPTSRTTTRTRGI